MCRASVPTSNFKYISRNNPPSNLHRGGKPTEPLRERDRLRVSIWKRVSFLTLKQIPILFLLLGFLCVSFSERHALAQTIGNYTPDPAGGTLAFARAHWASSINKMIVFFGPGNATGDNSIRAFDPV